LSRFYVADEQESNGCHHRQLRGAVLEMPTIKVLDTGYDSFAYEEQLFLSHGCAFEIWPGDAGDEAGKVAFAADADGLLIRWSVVNDAFLAAMKQLKAIVRYGVGYENIDLDAASRAGVKVAIVQGYGNHAVSDHALALMYACNRLLPQGHRAIREVFGEPPDKRVLDFHEATLGIIGLGRIGGTLCQKAVHLFQRVRASDPYICEERFEELGAEQVGLEELIQTSDVISVHCNLTQETTGLLNERTLGLARRCPIIINTARGPVIDQDALLQALHEQRIFGAGIDVYHTELASDLPEELLNHPRIICTGHYAWYSLHSHRELQRRAADNLLALLRGENIEDCLNP